MLVDALCREFQSLRYAATLGQLSGTLCGKRVPVFGEPEVYSRAFAEFALGARISAMSPYDLTDVCQPDAGALEFLLSMEALEYAEKSFSETHVKSNAVVTDEE